MGVEHDSSKLHTTPLTREEARRLEYEIVNNSYFSQANTDSNKQNTKFWNWYIDEQGFDVVIEFDISKQEWSTDYSNACKPFIDAAIDQSKLVKPKKRWAESLPLPVALREYNVSLKQAIILEEIIEDSSLFERRFTLDLPEYKHHYIDVDGKDLLIEYNHVDNIYSVRCSEECVPLVLDVLDP